MSFIHLFEKMKHWNLDRIGYWVIEAGCYIEKDLGLIPSPLNCSKDSWKLLSLFISISWPSLVTWRVVVQKIQKCTLSHVLILMTLQIWYILSWFKIQEREYLENGTWLFYEIKKFLNYASIDTFWYIPF